jgi:serine/threonine protein kinase
MIRAEQLRDGEDPVNDLQRQTVGPWTLGERLGRGGNATVWNATRSGSTTAVALKLINTKKVEREPYQRFVREIEFLRDHQDIPGLLPLLDAHLPDQPDKTDQPWLAMPIATPIAQALEGRPLTHVVAAAAAIADTLARLQHESGIAHRDIKPGNLYELDGRWLIGDFGLIAVPDAKSLTQDGRQVGPAHYTAYEMILNPAAADPHPADVYSLGKTLWVLATGQAFPPEGHQPTGTRGFGIGDFRPHPQAASLDQEVDLMTRLHPEERPSKDQAARDLALWQELAGEPVMLDLSAAGARLRAKLRSAIAEQDTQQQYKNLAHAAVRRLQQLTASLNEGLKNLYPRTQVDIMSDPKTQTMIRARSSADLRRNIIFSWNRCALVAPFGHPGSVTLRMSRSIELFSDGDLLVRLWVHVGREKTMGTFFDWQSPDLSAPVGSVELEKMLQDGVAELAQGSNKASKPSSSTSRLTKMPAERSAYRRLGSLRAGASHQGSSAAPTGGTRSPPGSCRRPRSADGAPRRGLRERCGLSSRPT